MEVDQNIGRLTVKIEADTAEFESQIEKCKDKLNELLALAAKLDSVQLKM